MKKFFLVLALYASHSLYADIILDHSIECQWDKNIIETIESLNEPKLDDCIPPELRNLPYGIYPTSPEYNTARLIFNKRFVYFPKAIFVPDTYDEVKHVIRAFRKHDLNFALRTGGHCFEPASLSSDFVLDLSHFNEIIPDVANSEVTLGAGCKLKRVIHELGALDFAIPTGTCPSNVVNGLTLGGGIGFLNRKYGLTCDAVKSIKMLTADAEIIEVSKHSHPNLFWALLGAGNGSYGIALQYKFEMFFIPVVSFYELSWKWNPKKITPIMQAWQKWVKTLPDDITTVLGVRHANEMCAEPENTHRNVIRIFGLKISDQPFTEWKKAFKKLKPHVKIFTGTYLEMSKFWAKESKLPFNKIKSRILFKPISNNVIAQVERFFERLEERNPDFLAYFNFEAFGGRMADFHTSFFPQDAFAWWEMAYYWDRQEQSDKILALANEFYFNIPSEVSKFCYANIVDYDIGPDFLKLYYGDHVKRLIKVKDKFDPTNFFHWRQSIPTSESLESSSRSENCHFRLE